VPTDPRTDEISHKLRTFEDRLTKACQNAGREREAITLIGVTKTFPADDVRRLASLGVRDIGENRDRELAAKAAALTDLDVHWHFVGQLQANKCRSVVQYADTVHSVDRDRLVHALSTAAVAAGRTIDVFVQVSLDNDPHRGGAPNEDVPALADRVVGADGVRLVGVMAVAPLGADPTEAFARLADVAAVIRAAHPTAVAISAGMSGDLEAAVANGATHVRIGTALLGGRPPAVR
jgi:hypothetical protein